MSAHLRFSSHRAPLLLITAGTVLGLLQPDVLSGQPSPTPTNSYMRVVSPDTNSIELQIAVRQLLPARKGAPKLSLVGVSHLGETNYYQSIQKLLDAHDLVLFEGVRSPGEEDGGQQRKMAEVDEASLQFTMARSLGLAFQLSVINYEQAHFRNSDLSLDQIGQLLTRRPRPGAAEGKAEPPERAASPELHMLVQVMDGSSFLGMVANGIVRMLGSSPRLQSTTKLMLIELLGNLQGDLTEMGALPPDMKRFLSVLLHARNAVVVNDVRLELDRPKPARNIAVFYGAAHMHDLEKRLCQELGYRPGEDQWLPAIRVNLPDAGLTAADLAMVRGLVQWQMKLLQQPRPE
jgi:hypothetical protein